MPKGTCWLFPTSLHDRCTTIRRKGTPVAHLRSCRKSRVQTAAELEHTRCCPAGFAKFRPEGRPVAATEVSPFPRSRGAGVCKLSGQLGPRCSPARPPALSPGSLLAVGVGASVSRSPHLPEVTGPAPVRTPRRFPEAALRPRGASARPSPRLSASPDPPSVTKGTLGYRATKTRLGLFSFQACDPAGEGAGGGGEALVQFRREICK